MSQSTNDAASSPFVKLSADAACQFLLLDLARRFKGTDLEIDRKIDAHAEEIAGRAGITAIPPIGPNEPRVPMYMEGEPGVGKTSIARAAAKKFCQLVGLNYVENPSDGYQFGRNDFYFINVNLSGKNNTMDIGGLPTKNALTADAPRTRQTDAGEWLLGEIESRIRAIGNFTKLPVSAARRYDVGGLNANEITITGEPDKVDAVVREVIKQLGEEIKSHGAGLNLLADQQDPQDGRLSLQVKKGQKGARLVAFAPARSEAAAEYVAEMLPNRRFALASKVQFSLVNFDDVANASEAVRNVLLEVTQSNRYSGVMDLGNAYITMSGNMGALDNTNTQSEQSDAEVSRVFKVQIYDTPKAWCQRITRKYSESGAGDCMMASFIARHGNEDGIFRDAIGDGRAARGIPKPNSRSLENALVKVMPFYLMAKNSGCSPTVFADEIEMMVKGTAGPVVATKYRSFMQSMLSEAIPLADQLMRTGEIDEAALERNLGSGARGVEQDFAFQFAAALSDSFIDEIAFSDSARAALTDAEKSNEIISVATQRMMEGLARLDPGTMNYALSRATGRMSSIARLGSDDGVAVKLTTATHMAMAEGFARARAKRVFPDDAKAEKDFVKIVAGTNVGGPQTRSQTSRAPR
jgi:hypothetical protein